MSESHNTAFSAPPLAPASTTPTGPSMTTAETLSGIFFEPSSTFEALRARPRFLIAALITLAAFMIFYVLFFQRLGYENIIRAQMQTRAPDMSPEQVEQVIATQ